MKKLVLGTAITATMIMLINCKVSAIEENKVLNNVKGVNCEEKVPVPVSSGNKQYVIGTSYIEGQVVKVEQKENVFFIVLKEQSGKETCYYSKYEEVKKALKDLKEKDLVKIKYSLGTPYNYENKRAFPILEGIKIEKNDNYKELKSYENVEENKVWTIKFNKGLNEEKIDCYNIFAKDSKGRRVKLEYEVISESNIVKIKPVEDYKRGEAYCIYLSKDVCNYNDGISDGFKIKFKIKKES